MNLAIEIILSLIMFIPSYIANPVAVVTGGKIIIDGGKTFRGKRIFGDHKTLSGLIGGILFGFLAGLILQLIGEVWSPLKYDSNIVVAMEIIFILSSGSMLGDLIGSFIKRQLGYQPGKEALFLDQYPFALTSLFLLFIFSPNIFIRIFPLPGVIAILIVTPLLHRAVNIIGFKMKMKDVPY